MGKVVGAEVIFNTVDPPINRDALKKPRISAAEIERKLADGDYVRLLRDDFMGQAWGGAGVVVQHSACRDVPEVNVPGTKVFRTVHAQAVGRLFRDIGSWVFTIEGYNYLSKAWFWDQLIIEGFLVVKAEPAITGSQLLWRIWAKALWAGKELDMTRPFGS